MNLLDYDKERLSGLVRELGYPEYRAAQLHSWLYRDVSSFSGMTDLPLSLREQLEKQSFRGIPETLSVQTADDGTAKTLWRYPDGNTAESVLMRYKHGYSACLSTQVGCKMGCAFCASAANGFVRQLTGGEITGQYLGLRMLAAEPVQRVVLMGMGEPLDNFDNVQEFLTGLKDNIGLSMRHVSLSTCGLPDGIRRLSETGLPVTLSVSLHAPDDETRSRLMPVNKRFPIGEVLNACEHYFDVTGRRVSYEYIMINGVNDSDEQAALTARLLRGSYGRKRPAHVNLIACNLIPGTLFAPSRRMADFKRLLESEGVTVTIRRRLGGNIDAACGQLRNRNM